MSSYNYSKCISFVITLIVLSLCVLPAEGQVYCTASGGCFEHISRVVVGSISNETICSGYGDYTSMSAIMEIGVSYNITVDNGNPYSLDQCGIWVDWNQNKLFADSSDPNETPTVIGNPGGGPYSATITPPANATLGDTRMRVRIVYNTTPTPCGNTSYGEVEDYTITVIDPLGDEVVFESATMGTPGQTTGWSISNTQIMGSRFHLDETVEVTKIGGHLLGSTTGKAFGAIISLSSSSALPSGSPFTGPEVLASFTFNAGFPSNDYYAYVSVTLPPGDYALIFGSGYFGADSGDRGVMPDNNTDLPGSTYFFWDGANWYNTTSIANTRFVVEGIPQVSGTISGYKFNDIDGDGLWNGSELGLPGWQIYLDLNANGQQDPGEPNTITGSAPIGYYEFTSLDPNTYIVTEILQTDWYQTFPSGDGTHSIILGAGETVENINFGNNDTGAMNISIQPIDDTYINSAAPDTNYGSQDNIRSGKNGSAVYRSYLKFDLSSVPPGNVITSATLRLINKSISVSPPQLDVKLTNDNWEELTATWNDGYPNTVTVTPIVINRSSVSGDDTTWPVTSEADKEYANDGFYSLLIISASEGLTQDASFWSKDSGVPNMAPSLEILYEPIFGGGSGEPNDPYQIWTPEQFNTIGLYSNRWSKHYKLMADISMASHSGWNFNPIGGFGGVFDGNGHTISDFSCFAQSSGASNNIGLFDRVSGGTIKNLTLIAPDVSPNSYAQSYVGPIAGYVSEGNIIGCSVVGGTVEGDSFIGGIVGACNGGFVADCSSSASVSGTNIVGGVIGGKSSFGGLPKILNCYARGAVTGDDKVGGFVGDSSDLALFNCYSTGLVTGTTNKGGFSGYNVNEYPYGLNVVDCFWDTTTSNMPTSAAGAGLATTAMQNINTYLTVGWDFVNETDNGGSDDWAMPGGGGYPILWHELPSAPALPSFAGGTGTSANPYLIGTSTQLNSIGHNPRLMDKHFRLNSDLDMGPGKFYHIADEPYVFSGTFDGAGHSVSNITIEPDTLFDMSPIGFVGTLYGASASIENLTLVDPNVFSTLGWHVGSLVGLNEGGTITNCHAVNVNVYGLISVGGLVGTNYQYANISGCSATGNVEENTFMELVFSPAGGLVGENSFWSNIENSFAKCNVSGGDALGGLVGSNVIYCTLTNCYSQGTVTGSGNYLGGFAGRNAGRNETYYCYSSTVVTAPPEATTIGGFIGSGSTTNSYTACFWDSDLNSTWPSIGSQTDPNVVGETTANLQTSSTFTAKGWDFVDETTNGTVDIWNICEGTNYPRLSWQKTFLGDFVCPDGVEINDFVIFINQWLLEVLSADLAPAEPDRFVDFQDWTVFSSAWLSTANPLSPSWNENCDISPQGGDGVIDLNDLIAFSLEWLQLGAWSADIAPEGGDGVVNVLDFNAFAGNWQEGI